MKIGILTFHQVHNYGAVMQALGLQRKITEMGHEVRIIDYSIFKEVKFFEGLGIRKYGLSFFLKHLSIFIKRKYYLVLTKLHFQRFEKKYLKLTSKVKDKIQLGLIADNFDFIIVGSDQVWNYYTTNSEFHQEFFLNFTSQVKISYAASFGVEQPIRYSNDIKMHLNDFKAISVRDEVSFNYLKSIIDKPIKIVCDPTLLIDFDKYAEPYINKNMESKYCLVFAFNEIEGFKDVLALLKRELKLQIIAVGTDVYKPYVDYTIPACSPENWLFLLKNASFVFTHSFHGIIFSLKYNVRFLCFKYAHDNAINQRVIDISKRYGFPERIIDNKEEARVVSAINSPMNFDKINSNIEIHIQESIEFLNSNLC